MSGIIMQRRQFAAGLIGLIAAPMVVRASSLMAVKGFGDLIYVGAGSDPDSHLGSLPRHWYMVNWRDRELYTAVSEHPEYYFWKFTVPPANRIPEDAFRKMVFPRIKKALPRLGGGWNYDYYGFIES